MEIIIAHSNDKTLRKTPTKNGAEISLYLSRIIGVIN